MDKHSSYSQQYKLHNIIRIGDFHIYYTIGIDWKIMNINADASIALSLSHSHPPFSPSLIHTVDFERAVHFAQYLTAILTRFICSNKLSL